MLKFGVTKNGAGIELWGDSETLRGLHGHISRIVANSPSIQNKESFLGLADDIQNAYEKNRLTHSPLHADEGPIYGVPVLWPDLVAQLGVLRAAMAYADFSKKDQAYMYDLEAVVEDAAGLVLVKYKHVDEVMYQMQRIGSYLPEHVWNLLPSRNAYFAKLPPEQRTNFILPVLRSLDPMYEMFADNWVKAAVEELIIPIEDFNVEDGGSFPDFEW